MGTAMFYLELHGTTDQRHILRALQVFYRFLDGMKIDLVLDDTLDGEQVIWRRVA